MRSWGRLLRLSLAPTAMADVAAGIVLAAGRWPAGAEPWLLLLASASVYHGALVLNDWADLERDRVERPDRPLPSGAVSPGRALALAGLLLAASPLLGFAAGFSSGSVLVAVLALALAYDLFLRGPWIGPLLLALCRAGNLAAGLVFLDASPGAPWVLLPLVYGAYVFAVSRLGRLEDREDRLEERRLHPRWLLIAAAAALPGPAVLALLSGARSLGSPGLLASLALSCAAAASLAAASAGSDWTPTAIQRRMGMALRRLLVFAAAVALLSDSLLHGALVAGAILCGYPLSHALRRAFPPT
jgi:4-hydroxybenzoate polyprenyltransferase